jgi:hypothetical protein
LKKKNTVAEKNKKTSTKAAPEDQAGGPRAPKQSWSGERTKGRPGADGGQDDSLNPPGPETRTPQTRSGKRPSPVTSQGKHNDEGTPTLDDETQTHGSGTPTPGDELGDGGNPIDDGTTASYGGKTSTYDERA